MTPCRRSARHSAVGVSLMPRPDPSSRYQASVAARPSVEGGRRPPGDPRHGRAAAAPVALEHLGHLAPADRGRAAEPAGRTLARHRRRREHRPRQPDQARPARGARGSAAAARPASRGSRRRVVRLEGGTPLSTIPRPGRPAARRDPQRREARSAGRPRGASRPAPHELRPERQGRTVARAVNRRRPDDEDPRATRPGRAPPARPRPCSRRKGRRRAPAPPGRTGRERVPASRSRRARREGHGCPRR